MSSSVLSKSAIKNFLLVEGQDDKEAFYALLNYYGITENTPAFRERFKVKNEHFEIKNCDGIDNLLEDLKVRLKGSESSRIGVVVDADANLEDTWRRLQNVLNSSGYTFVLEVPDSAGTIIKQEGLFAVGIWLMPNNQLPGMIEDFISFLRPPDDILWPMAEDIVQKVIVRGCRFRPTYKSKACLHTWLAWQKEPGKPMGQAITKRYVDADALHAQQLISWFRKVFDFESL